jgi:hypothetical protein
MPHLGLGHDFVDLVSGIEHGPPDVLAGKGRDILKGRPIGDKRHLEFALNLAHKDLIAGKPRQDRCFGHARGVEVL